MSYEGYDIGDRVNWCNSKGDYVGKSGAASLQVMTRVYVVTEIREYSYGTYYDLSIGDEVEIAAAHPNNMRLDKQYYRNIRLEELGI